MITSFVFGILTDAKVLYFEHENQNLLEFLLRSLQPIMDSKPFGFFFWFSQFRTSEAGNFLPTLNEPAIITPSFAPVFVDDSTDIEAITIAAFKELKKNHTAEEKEKEKEIKNIEAEIKLKEKEVREKEKEANEKEKELKALQKKNETKERRWELELEKQKKKKLAEMKKNQKLKQDLKLKRLKAAAAKKDRKLTSSKVMIVNHHHHHHTTL